MKTALLSLAFAGIVAAAPPKLGNGYTPPATLKAVTTLGNCTLTWSDATQDWRGTCPAMGGVEPLNLAAIVVDTMDAKRGKVLGVRYGGGTTGPGVATSSASPLDSNPLNARIVIEPSGFDGFKTYRTKITGTISE